MVKLLQLWVLQANHSTGHSSLVRKQAGLLGTRTGQDSTQKNDMLLSDLTLFGAIPCTIPYTSSYYAQEAAGCSNMVYVKPAAVSHSVHSAPL